MVTGGGCWNCDTAVIELLVAWPPLEESHIWIAVGVTREKKGKKEEQEKWGRKWTKKTKIKLKEILKTTKMLHLMFIVCDVNVSKYLKMI